jgi:tetratricopeptide (TPR) repeat protein
MKKTVIAFVVLCGVIAGAIVFLNKQKASPPVPAPVAELTPGQPAQPASPEKIAAPKPESPPTISANAGEPAKISAATPVASEVKPADSTNPIHKAVDALLSAKNAEEKHAVFQQLLKDGQLDAAMAELKQRAADNPNNAQLPTTLGEAQLNKVRAIKEAGGDVNEMGILAMQADQSFNAALKIDPQNWEANFVKAASMYYWPADEKRDNDVVQRLASLIDQQETLTPNPAFVQTYVVLGNQYEKMGQHDKAVATWQLGLTKFPDEPALQKKISGQ